MLSPFFKDITVTIYQVMFKDNLFRHTYYKVERLVQCFFNFVVTLMEHLSFIASIYIVQLINLITKKKSL